MALAHNMFEQLVDDELTSVVEEQDWGGVRKYIASYYKSLPPEEQRRLYEERFKSDYIKLVDNLLNDQHLKLGTQKENMADMHAKGRFRGGAPSGNKNAAGNKGWQRGGATAKYFTPKLGAEVDVPEGLLK